jgi:hypothetical protein
MRNIYKKFTETYIATFILNTLEQELILSFIDKTLFVRKRSDVTMYAVVGIRSLYSSLNIVWVVKTRRMRWAGHVARMWEDRGVHRLLVRMPEGKGPLGRPSHRWEESIKMDL